MARLCRADGFVPTFSAVLVAGAVLFWHAPAAADDPPRAAAEEGRLEGRITAADSGKPVAGARVRVLVMGRPGKKAVDEAVTDADGVYRLAVPLGHCQVWGIFTPAGYYTQDSGTHVAVTTTAAEPRVVRNFLLQPGSPWRVEVPGEAVSGDQPPYFSAWFDPDRTMFASGEIIETIGDARGKAVLTIPPTGGRYRFNCGIISLPSRWETSPANLEIDKDFDPRQVQGIPEPLAERKAVRLRDKGGRSAMVEGADVLVDSGQAVLRFRAKRIPTTAAFQLRGAAVDEAGKPVAGARFTAAIASGNSAGMSELQATTDAQGKFEMRDVLLPKAVLDSDSRIRMIVTKAGLDGAQTGELNLLEVHRTGSGEFGTMVLKPGHTLRGKVVDEEGRSLHGAVVTNMTNYFLYGHLRCRTDVTGRFTMPDLSFGTQQISAQFGERAGQVDFAFDAKSGECVVTVQPIPKSGVRSSPAPRQRAARPAQPVPDEGAWDLTPPTREPRYQKEPRYALLVFGPRREQRVWMVLDGTTLYVDRNGNGDLTEPDERLEPTNPKDGSNRFGGSGSHTHFDIFEFTVQAGVKGTSRFRLDHWIRAENFTPKTDFDKELHADWLKLRHENSTLWRKDGLGQGQTPLIFMPKPADAQVCALDGPLTFAVKLPQYQVLQRGEGGGDLAFHIVVMGRPYRGATQQLFNPLATSEVPGAAHLEVEIEYPTKAGQTEPLRRKYILKQRC
jgi:hypothetical protein